MTNNVDLIERLRASVTDIDSHPVTAEEIWARSEASAIRHTRHRPRRRRLVVVAAAAAFVVLSAGVALMARSGTSDQRLTTASQPQVSTPEGTTSAPTISGSSVVPTTTACPATDGSSVRITHFSQAPPMCIDPASDYDATIHTTKGNLSLLLLSRQAPQSVNNFVVLARYHSYDGLPVTRITPRGWAEIADPISSDAQPHPGYRIPGEPLTVGAVGTPLIVATLPDSSGTSGGGFLFGLADQARNMPANATVIGNISDSRLDTTKKPELTESVQRIIGAAATPDGTPSEAITITSITITEHPAAPPLTQAP